MPKRLILIDSANFLHRAFYAFPMNLTTPEGQPINAVYGFSSMLISLASELEPTHMVCALESQVETVFREVEFEEYKATRPPKSPEEQEAYESQIPLFFEFLEAAQIGAIKAERYEADDVIGTVAKKVMDSKPQETGGAEVIIASNDRDLMQLIGGPVRFYLPAVGKGKKESKIYGEREFVEEFGFEPKLLVDYKSLRGDPSDNIPGVYGIGKVTATNLIKKYGSMEEIYSHLGELKPSVAKKLKEGEEQAKLSKRLATIVTDAPVDFKMADFEFRGLDTLGVKKLFEKWRFKSLLEKISPDKSEQGKEQLKLV